MLPELSSPEITKWKAYFNRLDAAQQQPEADPETEWEELE
jgi:hypothetical protein